MTAGNLAGRSGFVERTGNRTVAERLGSVAALARIPLINNHIDRHLASPHAARALFLVCSWRKSPMTALPVVRKWRWNAAPRGRRRLIINDTDSDFQIADLIEFNSLKPQDSNRIFADSSLLAEPTVDVDAFDEYVSETLTIGLWQSGRAARNAGDKFGHLFRPAAP
jgi:hypothetical protein